MLSREEVRSREGRCFLGVPPTAPDPGVPPTPARGQCGSSDGMRVALQADLGSPGWCVRAPLAAWGRAAQWGPAGDSESQLCYSGAESPREAACALLPLVAAL